MENKTEWSLENKITGTLTDNDKIKLDELQNEVLPTTKDEQVFVILEDRKLGFISVVFLIVNTMIGTGIFSTPANVYRAVNNVGTAFMLWLTGAILTISE